MGISVIAQTIPNTNREASNDSSKNKEYSKIIVRSAARGSWAATRFTARHVVAPLAEFTVGKTAETAPKVSQFTLRVSGSAAKEAARVGIAGLRRIKGRLPI